MLQEIAIKEGTRAAKELDKATWASAVATISFAGASLDISDAVADVTSPVPAAASGRTAPSTIDGAAAVSPTTGATPEASVF